MKRNLDNPSEFLDAIGAAFRIGYLGPYAKAKTPTKRALASALSRQWRHGHADALLAAFKAGRFSYRIEASRMADEADEAVRAGGGEPGKRCRRICSQDLALICDLQSGHDGPHSCGARKITWKERGPRC